MDFSPGLVQKLSALGIDVTMKMIEGVITAPRFKEAPSPPSAPKTCSACQIYTDVVMARAYIKDLKPKLTPDGKVPEGLGGTIVRAQGNIHSAIMLLPSVKGFNPNIDSAATELQVLLPQISTRLNYIGSEAEWNWLIVNLEHAEEIAYLIPEGVYRRDTQEIVEEHIEDIVLLSDEEKELLRSHRSQKDGVKQDGHA